MTFGAEGEKLGFIARDDSSFSAPVRRELFRACSVS